MQHSARRPLVPCGSLGCGLSESSCHHANILQHLAGLALLIGCIGCVRTWKDGCLAHNPCCARVVFDDAVCVVAWPVHSVDTADWHPTVPVPPSNVPVYQRLLLVGWADPSPCNVCCFKSYLHWLVWGVHCCATQHTHTFPFFNPRPADVGVCECTTHLSLTWIQQCCAYEGQGGRSTGWLKALTMPNPPLRCRMCLRCVCLPPTQPAWLLDSRSRMAGGCFTGCEEAQRGLWEGACASWQRCTASGMILVSRGFHLCFPVAHLSQRACVSETPVC
jgi:hypothetical protein